MNGAPVWLVFLGAILSSAAFSSVVGAIINRRKLGAETGALSATATETITKAASAVLQQSRDDNHRLRQENAELRVRETERDLRIDILEQDALEARRREEDWRRVLQLHAAWDHLAVTKLNEAHPPIELPAPPPLSPPTT
jgi:hypothetical protein